MKISMVPIEVIKNYIKVDFEDDDLLIQLIADSAKAYLKAYTGIALDADLDTSEDLTICYLALIGEMYDNRAITLKEDKINKILDSILNMHCINLL